MPGRSGPDVSSQHRKCFLFSTCLAAENQQLRRMRVRTYEKRKSPQSIWIGEALAQDTGVESVTETWETLLFTEDYFLKLNYYRAILFSWAFRSISISLVTGIRIMPVITLIILRTVMASSIPTD